MSCRVAMIHKQSVVQDEIQFSCTYHFTIIYGCYFIDNLENIQIIITNDKLDRAIVNVYRVDFRIHLITRGQDFYSRHFGICIKMKLMCFLE